MTLNEHISWRQNLREYVPNSLNRVKKNTEPPVSTISCRTCLIQASIENFINNQSMWPVIAYVQRWLKVSKFPHPSSSTYYILTLKRDYNKNGTHPSGMWGS